MQKVKLHASENLVSRLECSIRLDTLILHEGFSLWRKRKRQAKTTPAHKCLGKPQPKLKGSGKPATPSGKTANRSWEKNPNVKSFTTPHTLLGDSSYLMFRFISNLDSQQRVQQECLIIRLLPLSQNYQSHQIFLSAHHT